MPNAYMAGWSHAGVNTADQVYANLSNTGTSKRMYVREVGVNISVAPTTAPLFYLARTTADGTVTTTLAGIALEPADGAAVGTLDTVWSVQPTKAGTVSTATVNTLNLTGGQTPTQGSLVIVPKPAGS